MFLEKLVEIVVSSWHALVPWIILDPYQGGVVLRLGLAHRIIGPGLSWKIPLVEHVLEATTCMTTMRLPPQTLTTKDGVGVVTSCLVKYSIKDVEPFLLGVVHQADVLTDITMGTVLSAVASMTYDELRAALPERDILEAVRKLVNKHGFRIESVTFVDFGKVRSLRLVTDNGSESHHS